MERQIGPVDLIMLTYRPDGKCRKSLERIDQQTVRPSHIYLINTEEALFPAELRQWADGRQDVTVVHIKKEEFDHGGTRRYAMTLSTAPYALLMTQDAVPAQNDLVEELLGEMQNVQTGVAYARQLCGSLEGEVERYTRRFNYPPGRQVKTKSQIDTMGIKAFFCSDVCALYRKSAYELCGGFLPRAIFNEDMVMAYRLLQHGYQIVYAAQARVIHSHHYTAGQQFHRNFDLGVSQRMNWDVFGSIHSESEGVKLVKKTTAFLLQQGKVWLIPSLIWSSAAKYLGYQLGRHYDRLPLWLVRRCTMSPGFWEKEPV